jgi:hypothetical protein
VDDVVQAEGILRDELGLVEVSRTGEARLRIADL